MAAALEPRGTGEDGNTKRPPYSKKWCFTLNNATFIDQVKLGSIGNWSRDIEQMVFQMEIGESGNQHLQGAVWFKRKIRVLETVPHELFLTKKPHWEQTKHWKASVQYCQKKDTRAPGFEPVCYPTSLKTEEPLVLEPDYEEADWRPWQKEMADILAGEPDSREILVVEDILGGCGKTVFARDYCIRHRSALYVNGDRGSILYALQQGLARNQHPRVIFFDMARGYGATTSKDWETVEVLKNRIAFAKKYESGMLIWNHVHIVVYTNFEVDKNMLSADRWHFVEPQIDELSALAPGFVMP